MCKKRLAITKHKINITPKTQKIKYNDDIITDKAITQKILTPDTTLGYWSGISFYVTPDYTSINLSRINYSIFSVASGQCVIYNHLTGGSILAPQTRINVSNISSDEHHSICIQIQGVGNDDQTTIVLSMH